MSEIENGRLGLRLHGTEHSKCNYLATLGFKRLRTNIPWVGGLSRLENDYSRPLFSPENFDP